MSEEREFLSKRALLIIGITALVILVLGLILFYAGLNEEFYVSRYSTQRIFEAITYLGEPVAFIIIAAILFLAYNKRFAKSLALSLLFSYYLNELIKDIIQDPRPDTNIDSTEEYGFIEPSYGFPSGHAQQAISFWGYLANEFKDVYEYKRVPIIPVVFSALIFLVAISRIIIGVHDLQDMIGGLLIGIGCLILFIYLEPIFSKQFNKLSFTLKIIIAVVISICIFLSGTLIFPNAGLGLVDPPLKFRDAGAFGQIGGVLLGFGVGYIIEHEYVNYEPSTLTNKKKIINIIIGIVILLVVVLPLEYLLEIDSVFYRFARYAIITFILAFVIPLICTKVDRKI